LSKTKQIIINWKFTQIREDDKFYIDINEAINESLENISVLDLNGKILSSAKTVILNDKIVINLENQPKGIYVVRLVFDSEVVSLRVVKE
jgi:hypothetical protein